MPVRFAVPLHGSVFNAVRVSGLLCPPIPLRGLCTGTLVVNPHAEAKPNISLRDKPDRQKAHYLIITICVSVEGQV